jgi:AsmA-like C-terminal region
MSQTLSEPVLHTPPSADTARPRRRSWTRWPRRIALLLVLLWVADFGVSLLIRHTRLQRRLTGRLESVFGRSVEVGRYDFSLWGGPTLEAQSVTFGEDPRFGHEYFLRADSLTVRLRWQSFFRGHMELGAIALQHPSLNLVRNDEGDWNVAEWLPKSAAGAVPSSSPAPAVRFGRIDVASGRINFKHGDEKLPFALTDVNGYIEPDRFGRWTLNLEAVPARAALLLQQAGTIRVSGHVGGTSSRLRPAVLDLAWDGASLSDLLHLAHGYDFGVRGDLGLVVHAETEGDNWALQSRAELRRLHRWDFAARPDNPAVNVSAKMILYPLASGLDITEATIEAPHSWARADAHFAWPSETEAEFTPRTPLATPAQFEITQAQVELSDVLAWVRAFHSNVGADVSLSGSASVHAGFSAWPLHLTSAAGAIANANLSGTSLRVPAHLSQAQFRYEHEMFSLLPATVSYGATDGSVHVEAIAGTSPREFPVYRLSGNLVQVRDLVATAGSLGWNISRGWDLAGPVRCDLHWQGGRFPWETQPIGTIEWGGEPSGGSLLTPFLNQPVKQIRARAELKPGLRHIALTSADAFGARWTGTFDRYEDRRDERHDARHADAGAVREWEFALSTDALSLADLDRWLNPRWRQSFLDRLLPFLNSSSPANAVPENLRAEGRINVEDLALAPLALRHFESDVKIGGRHIEVSRATAQFFGGALTGSLDAQLTATPAYRLNIDYSRVNLAALTAAFPTLADLFGGSASGEFAFDSSGATRADLISSLGCRGTARITDATLQNISLLESMREGERRTGVTSFPAASAVFSCGDGKIVVQRLHFSGAAQDVAASGSVDFSRDVNLQLRVLPSGGGVGAPRPAANATQIFNLTGPIRSPDIRTANPSAARADERETTEQRN